MALSTYCTLVVGTEELKWLHVLAATSENGITQADLTAAEKWAFNKINLWIVKVAGRVTGAAIISAFVGMAAISDLDPVIKDLATLLASARLLRLDQERNYIQQGSAGSDQLRRKDWEEVQQEAVALANDIERARVTVKVDGTLRTWGAAPGKPGPVVGGPMADGSLFDDSRTYTDRLGNSWTLPHRHPLDGATPGPE